MNPLTLIPITMPVKSWAIGNQQITIATTHNEIYGFITEQGQTWQIARDRILGIPLHVDLAILLLFLENKLVKIHLLDSGEKALEIQLPPVDNSVIKIDGDLNFPTSFFDQVFVDYSSPIHVDRILLPIHEKLTGIPGWRILLSSGERHFEQANYLVALDYYCAIMNSNEVPNLAISSLLCFRRGLCHYHIGEYHSALAWFGHATATILSSTDKLIQQWHQHMEQWYQQTSMLLATFEVERVKQEKYARLQTDQAALMLVTFSASNKPTKNKKRKRTFVPLSAVTPTKKSMIKFIPYVPPEDGASN